VPNIEDVARWLAAPPEELAELGFAEGGGEGSAEALKGLPEKIAPQPVMAKVLKVGKAL